MNYSQLFEQFSPKKIILKRTKLGAFCVIRHNRSSNNSVIRSWYQQVVHTNCKSVKKHLHKQISFERIYRIIICWLHLQSY